MLVRNARICPKSGFSHTRGEVSNQEGHVLNKNNDQTIKVGLSFEIRCAATR